MRKLFALLTMALILMTAACGQGKTPMEVSEPDPNNASEIPSESVRNVTGSENLTEAPEEFSGTLVTGDGVPEEMGSTAMTQPDGETVTEEDNKDTAQGITDGMTLTETESTVDNTMVNTMADETEVSKVKIKITVGDTELTAEMEDNATTQAIISQMPMTLPMMDLYGREMCYRYGAYALPTDYLQSDGYEVGDIAYWAPGGSLVILYAQNGEHFERQHLGHIDSGVEVFENTGDVDVAFEVIAE